MKSLFDHWPQIVYEDFNAEVHGKSADGDEDIREELRIEVVDEEEDDKEDLSRMLGPLCETDWYREYEREELTGLDNQRRSPVYVEEQESSSEYIKGSYLTPWLIKYFKINGN